jgi:hypothetical protein
MTYVSIIGVFVTALGFCLMMFFEPNRPASAPIPSLGDSA